MKQSNHDRSPHTAELYIRFILRWILVTLLIGASCGVVGGIFYEGVVQATNLRETHRWLLFLLPVFGLVITFVYRTLGAEGQNTDTIIDAAREGTGLKINLLPSIFIGTILTHLGGGSAGREGAALQLGGNLGNHVGKLLKLDQSEMRVATMAGMAAFFSAVFGTPLTATVFAVFFISYGTFYSFALLPSFLASVIAYVVSRRFGMVPFAFQIDIPDFQGLLFLKVIVLAVLAGILSVIWVEALHRIGKLYHKYLKNPYVRVVVGGIIVVLISLIPGMSDYNGTGGAIIAAALNGTAHPLAFVLKILVTALTLEAGFKGGEIVPTFFIGATFGCVVGPFLGIPAGFAAAIAMIAAFAGATNTEIPSMFLAIEVFGANGLLYFALACMASHLVSGYNGLYSSQTIVFSKLKPERIDITPNNKLYGIENDLKDGKPEDAI